MWRFVECCGFAIYSGLTPPLLHSSTRLVNSGAELSEGSSLCPLQIPYPITVSERPTSRSTYTLRTPPGCGPFFLVLGHVLLQISQRTLENELLGERVTYNVLNTCRSRLRQSARGQGTKALFYSALTSNLKTHRSYLIVAIRNLRPAICDPQSAFSCPPAKHPAFPFLSKYSVQCP
jgi:hypothetical protein